jgi:hypothetical protein
MVDEGESIDHFYREIQDVITFLPTGPSRPHRKSCPMFSNMALDVAVQPRPHFRCSGKHEVEKWGESGKPTTRELHTRFSE